MLARICGLENTLIGACPRSLGGLQGGLHQGGQGGQAADGVGAAALGAVLFEMCAGAELEFALLPDLAPHYPHVSHSHIRTQAMLMFGDVRRRRAGARAAARPRAPLPAREPLTHPHPSNAYVRDVRRRRAGARAAARPRAPLPAREPLTHPHPSNAYVGDVRRRRAGARAAARPRAPLPAQLELALLPDLAPHYPHVSHSHIRTQAMLMFEMCAGAELELALLPDLAPHYPHVSHSHIRTQAMLMLEMCAGAELELALLPDLAPHYPHVSHSHIRTQAMLMFEMCAGAELELALLPDLAPHYPHSWSLALLPDLAPHYPHVSHSHIRTQAMLMFGDVRRRRAGARAAARPRAPLPAREPLTHPHPSNAYVEMCAGAELESRAAARPRAPLPAREPLTHPHPSNAYVRDVAGAELEFALLPDLAPHYPHVSHSHIRTQAMLMFEMCAGAELESRAAARPRAPLPAREPLTHPHPSNAYVRDVRRRRAGVALLPDLAPHYPHVSHSHIRTQAMLMLEMCAGAELESRCCPTSRPTTRT
ncbi:hypothetical protein ACJJTC_012567 [Scirpophaga incertulas]